MWFSASSLATATSHPRTGAGQSQSLCTPETDTEQPPLSPAPSPASPSNSTLRAAAPDRCSSLCCKSEADFAAPQSVRHPGDSTIGRRPASSAVASDDSVLRIIEANGNDGASLDVGICGQ